MGWIMNHRGAKVIILYIDLGLLIAIIISEALFETQIRKTLIYLD